MDIKVVSNRIDYYGLQVIDGLAAYMQSQAEDFVGVDKIEMVTAPVAGAYNILFLHMPSAQPADYSVYDLVILDNAIESINICTPVMYEMLKTKENCYMFSGSILPETHELYNKVISIPGKWQLCLDYWTSMFYPQKYQNNNAGNKQGLIYVNVKPRTWSKHFLSQLPDTIAVSNKDAASEETTCFRDSASPEDIQFGDFLRARYPSLEVVDPVPQVPIGIGTKFGNLHAEFFHSNEFSGYKIVAFPERSWRNNDLVVSERGLKCFASETLPMPIGGANIHSLYKQMGFTTAHELLPSNLKFDSEPNHVLRQRKEVKALTWLQDNVDSVYNIDVVKQNKAVLFENQYIETQIARLYNIVKK